MAHDKSVLDHLAKAVILFDSEELNKSLDRAIDSRMPIELIVKEGLGRGMEIVGEKYEKGVYFLSDLIMSGVVMNEAMERLRPMLTHASSDREATIVIGTVEGDLHDIGKNLVKSVLESGGYNLVDLGTDVPPERFVLETQLTRPAIVCMSALLSVTMPKVKETIEALAKAGLRDNTKILVGGRSLTEKISKDMGADAYGRDCFDGLKKAKDLTKHS